MHARETQINVTIFSINYPPSDGLCLIRRTINQEQKDKYHEIAHEKNDHLFYKIHPFSTFESLPDGKFTTWESKTFKRFMSNHTYDNVYLKMIKTIPSDIYDEQDPAESAERLTFECRKVNIFRQPFSFFNLYNNLYEIFHVCNYRHPKQLTASIKSVVFST